MTETKRKPGRPSSRQTETQEKSDMPPATEPATRASAREPWGVLEEPKAGPQCLRCNTPTERNTSLFKAFDLPVIRCMKCRHVAIEGDTLYFDLVSAGTGQLYRRAQVVFEQRFPTRPVPNVAQDRVSDLINSDIDDPRWSE